MSARRAARALKALIRAERPRIRLAGIEGTDTRTQQTQTRSAAIEGDATDGQQ